MRAGSLKALAVAAGMVPTLCAAQLPLSPMTGLTTAGAGLTSFYALGFELGPWQDYLARELTPGFLSDPDLPPLHISWLDPERVSMLPAFAESLVREPRTFTRYEVDYQRLETRNLQGAGGLTSPGMGFERRLITPGVFHQLNQHSLLGVEAVLAHQSYGTSRLGLQALSEPRPGASLSNPMPEFMPGALGNSFQPYQESGYGTGVRLNLSSEIAPGMMLSTGFQSRIDMEEFAYYRGVYSDPADFDIPARASLGLAFNAVGNSWLRMSVEHVMYSDVNAFQSRLLPDRLLSRLGDSTSPNYAWDDLTVYTVGYTWNNGKDLQWRFDLSSRTSPLPSAATLSRALSDEVADHAMLLGFSKRTGTHSRFSFNAAYASADFLFGGNVLGITGQDLDQDLEVEAFWTLDF